MDLGFEFQYPWALLLLALLPLYAGCADASARPPR